MAHGHAHHDHRGHARGPRIAAGRAFAIGVALNTAFAIIEGGFGLFANSLALLADAAHNLSDVLGLLLAWGAASLARRAPSARFTYGMRGSTIMAALANALLLLVACGSIAWEAVGRFQVPAVTSATLMIGVAAAGVLVNAATATLFLHDRDRDLNIRGAYLHMVADAAVSLGVVVAGGVIVATGWLWLDPVTSLAIVAAILYGTWGLLRDSLALSMQAVPVGVEPAVVREHLAALPGVTEIHDLHIWAMSTTENALTAHLVMPAGHPGDAFLTALCRSLDERFGIHHATVQIEVGDTTERCELAPEHRV
jgi:cobalt-zinc-cadmium efflux system protein